MREPLPGEIGEEPLSTYRSGSDYSMSTARDDLGNARLEHLDKAAEYMQDLLQVLRCDASKPRQPASSKSSGNEFSYRSHEALGTNRSHEFSYRSYDSTPCSSPHLLDSPLAAWDAPLASPSSSSTSAPVGPPLAGPLTPICETSQCSPLVKTSEERLTQSWTANDGDSHILSMTAELPSPLELSITGESASDFLCVTGESASPFKDRSGSRPTTASKSRPTTASMSRPTTASFSRPSTASFSRPTCENYDTPFHATLELLLRVQAGQELRVQPGSRELLLQPCFRQPQFAEQEMEPFAEPLANSDQNQVHVQLTGTAEEFKQLQHLLQQQNRDSEETNHVALQLHKIQGQHEHQLSQLQAQHSGEVTQLMLQFERCKQKIEEMTGVDAELRQLHATLLHRDAEVRHLQDRLAGGEGEGKQLPMLLTQGADREEGINKKCTEEYAQLRVMFQEREEQMVALQVQHDTQVRGSAEEVAWLQAEKQKFMDQVAQLRLLLEQRDTELSQREDELAEMRSGSNSKVLDADDRPLESSTFISLPDRDAEMMSLKAELNYSQSQSGEGDLTLASLEERDAEIIALKAELNQSRSQCLEGDLSNALASLAERDTEVSALRTELGGSTSQSIAVDLSNMLASLAERDAEIVALRQSIAQDLGNALAALAEKDEEIAALKKDTEVRCSPGASHALLEDSSLSQSIACDLGSALALLADRDAEIAVLKEAALHAFAARDAEILALVEEIEAKSSPDGGRPNSSDLLCQERELQCVVLREQHKEMAVRASDQLAAAHQELAELRATLESRTHVTRLESKNSSQSTLQVCDKLFR